MGEINWGGLSWSEGFEGVDEDNVDAYDAAWVKIVAGTSTAKIDTAQFVGGAASLRLYRDGANNVYATRTINITTTYSRVSLFYRTDTVAGNVSRLPFLMDAAEVVPYVAVALIGGNFVCYYGNGAGGNNTVTLSAASINTWYKIDIDIDLVSDKYRVWFNGILKSGPNANSEGFDNFAGDVTTASIAKLELAAVIGTSNNWFDNIKIYTGWVQTNYLGSTPDPRPLPLARSTPVPKPGGG